MMSKFFIQRFLSIAVTSLALALFLSNLTQLLAPHPVSAQVYPASLPTVEVSTHPDDLLGLGLDPNLEAFVPSGLSQSASPVEGGRGVIGTDDRLPMTSSHYPWSAIGRVVGQSPIDETTIARSTCTGTLVDIDIVLTNAHCIVDSETHEPKQSVYFQPNLVNGQLQNDEDLAIVTKAWVATDFRDDSIRPNPNDWALLLLNRPLGETYGTLDWHPLPLETLVEEYQGQLTLVGYSGDFPADNPGETAGVHEGCSIYGDYQGNFIHDCDTTGGSSGGPILAEVDGAVRIVALNSAERVNVQPQAERQRPQRIGILNYAVQIARIVDTLVAQN